MFLPELCSEAVGLGRSLCATAKVVARLGGLEELGAQVLRTHEGCHIGELDLGI